MASQNHKDLVISRLREQSGLAEEEIEKVKWFSIASHYLSQPDHGGGIMIPGTKYHRRDGSEYTFEDVPLKKVLANVESAIKMQVASDRRSEVWHKVFQGIPGAKKPDWEKPIDNPRAEPETEFSVSRAAPGEVKSNADIIAALVSAAHLDEQDGFRIGGQITWWDSIDSKGNSGTFSLGGGVRGGRLGRDHTLEDVPNHYVRDRVLHYIDNEVPEEERDAVRKAVFPDLPEDERKQYSAAIVELERKTGGLVMRTGNKKNKSKGKSAPQSKASDSKQPSSTLSGPTNVDPGPVTEEGVARVIGDRPFQSAREAKVVKHQASVLDSISASDTDLSPRPIMGRRRSWVKPMSYSVITPGLESQLPQEETVTPGKDIDRDCDQIRAMIKILVTENDWTLDQFRHTLGGVTRERLTAFLEKTGPEAGSPSLPYEMGWEFFKRRDLLGLSLRGVGSGSTEPADGRVLGEGDGDVTQAKNHKHVSPGSAKERAEKRVKAVDDTRSLPLRRSARLRSAEEKKN